ncbi:cytochrome P450 [Xylariales sp. PMI_506]|nr:cytochrome P450 [Xylariales sp. PMI_506]
MVHTEFDTSPVGFLAAGTLAFACWYLATAVWSWYRLRHVPGPWLASFSYLWIARVNSRGQQYETYRDLCAKYGAPLVRVGPRELTSEDPELLRRTSSSRYAYRKGRQHLGNRVNPYHDTMFILLDPEEHDKVKARLAGAYGGRDTPDMEGNVDYVVATMVDVIRGKYLSRDGEYRPLVLSSMISLFTLDVISRLALGEEFGCVRSDDDIHSFLSTMVTHIPYMAMAVGVPLLREIIFSKVFLRFMGPKETDKHGIGKLMGITNKIVRERLAPGGNDKKKDIVASFVRNCRDVGEIESETLFMFIAGSETTASVLRITMLYILSNPRVYQKLKDEMQFAIRGGKVSSPIKMAEARELPYLQAVIYEGLRMRPVAPTNFCKDVPAGGDTVDGKFLPEGTGISFNIAAMLRSRVLFGEDANLFRPERFLELEGDALAEMRRNTELQFGCGRWMCAGKPIALMELNKMYFELLRNFDFELADPQKPMVSVSHTLWIDQGLEVRVTESDI